MTELKRDEYGYLNNRGASDYWGVTTSMVFGKRTWVITFRPSWSNKTLGLRSEGGKIQEKDAATVAAWLYENLNDSSLKDNTIRLRSRLNARRVLCFVPAQGQIWIENYSNQTLNEIQNNLTLDDALEEAIASLEDPVGQAVLELVQPDEHLTEEEDEEGDIALESKGLDERSLIALINDAILEGRISKRGAELMVSSLETVIY